MKNEKITRKESLIFIAFLWVLFLCLNLRVNCEKVRKLNEGEKEEIDNSTIHKCVVIDAGSTGTRVYIYNYKITNDDKEMKIYIPAISYRTTPGLVYILNDYFSNGEEKSFYDYFNNIKSFIYNNVLEEERETTFILLRASGGFRLLSINKSEKYINFVKNYFLKNFNEFLLIDDFLVKVLSGKEEAILSFVSIYALLGKFSPNPLIFTDQGEDDGTIGSVEEESKGESIPLDQDDDSIGVLELGGATAQVIIKIPMSKMNEDILNLFNYQHKENKKKGIIEENYKNKNIVKIHFCNKDIYLYCKSYLVLGRQNAMKTYLHYIVHENSKKDNTMNKYMHVACFPKDFKFYINNLYKTSIEEEIQEYNDNTQLGEYEFVGIGTGDIDLCRTQIQNILTHAQIDILPFKLKKFIKLYGIENFHHFAIVRGAKKKQKTKNKKKIKNKSKNKNKNTNKNTNKNKNKKNICLWRAGRHIEPPGNAQPNFAEHEHVPGKGERDLPPHDRRNKEGGQARLEHRKGADFLLWVSTGGHLDEDAADFSATCRCRISHDGPFHFPPVHG
ncbi:adenosine-diphosphatase, putative [Plasmodium ovale curtisi]|uniref:Adenosine-diphosphatase, putative n=1 Tax=Plasmodium ovale curtisi TaxID=864141 RepID=A0A1A8X7S8_PLAOA|nr:adenosine-diphosphatase, putative [Plasmodium ovale curtisi]